MPSAVIYVRISRDSAKEGLGVARQEGDCRELAAAQGLAVSHVYVDNDLSASSGKPRPAYREMLEAMQRREFDVVVGWHPDRMYRRPDELEELITIAEDNGVNFVTCRAGNIDLATASGRLVARLLGVVARHEVELKGERQAAKMRELAKAGKNMGGGSRAFGWADDRLALDPIEAPIVRELAERVLAGESVNALCTWLMESGVLTSAGGGRWAPITVRRMLVNPRLAGHSVYKGEVVGRGLWEPILEDATWRRVVEVLERRHSSRAAPPRVALFGSHLIRCGLCGYALLTYRRGPSLGRLRCYGCRERSIAGRDGYGRACNRIAIKAEALEEDVVERVLARIIHQRTAVAEAAEGIASPSSSAGEVSALEERLREVGVDYADGLLGRVEFRAARDRIAERLATARAQLAQSERAALPHGTAEDLTTWWDTRTVDQRRALIESQIERITVGPHSGARALYDPSRVQVTWR